MVPTDRAAQCTTQFSWVRQCYDLYFNQSHDHYHYHHHHSNLIMIGCNDLDNSFCQGPQSEVPGLVLVMLEDFLFQAFLPVL